MSAQSVKAGRAYIELLIDNQIKPGLDAAKKQITAWSASLAKIGAGLTGAGAGILGPLGAALASASGTASQLADISAATGVSAESLSALGYAAKLTGVSMEDLNTGLRGMAKFTGMVAHGNKGAIDTLNELGISAAAFMAATPEQRIAMLADGISKIKDPSLQSAAAIKVFGRSGSQLKQMFQNGAQGLRDAADEAARLGLVISSQDVGILDAIGDAWDTITLQFRAIAVAVSTALAPAMSAIAAVVQNVLAATISFIKHNQWLVIVIASVGAALLTAGAAVLGLALALAATGAIIGFISTSLSALGAAITFLMSPIGLLAVGIGLAATALIGGVVYWFKYTQAGMMAVSFLVKIISGLWAALSYGGWLEIQIIAINAFVAAWRQAAFIVSNLFWTLEEILIGVLKRMLAMLQEFIDKLLTVMSALASLLPKSLGGALSSARGVLGAGLTPEALDAVLKDIQNERLKAAADILKPATAAGGVADQASAEAQKRWDEMLAKLKERFKNAFAGLQPQDSASAVADGGTLGTFSASVAGLLGRSRPENHTKQIAENTGRTADTLEDILAKGGFNFEFE